VARLHAKLGEQAQAEAGYRRAAALLGELAEAQRQALAVREKLTADFPGLPAYQEALASGYVLLVKVLTARKKLDEAETAARQALAIRDRLAARFPAVPEHRHQLAISHNDLAVVLGKQGKRPAAEQAYERAIDLHQKLVEEHKGVHPYRASLALSYANLGILLGDQKKYAEAEAAYRKALGHRETLAGAFRDVPQYQADLASARFSLGHVLRVQGQAGAALPWYDQALALLLTPRLSEATDASTRLLLRNVHLGRAKALGSLNRAREALADWERVVELSPPAERARGRLERARGWVDAGKVAEAAADVAALTQEPATPGAVLCDGACVCARAAAVTLEGEQREAYAGQALALLRRARAAGFFKDRQQIERLRHTPDLEPLRTREDFRRFVAELEAAVAKP
jgi:tetratricopeptide (TPR) repeat protein